MAEDAATLAARFRALLAGRAPDAPDRPEQPAAPDEAAAQEAVAPPPPRPAPPTGGARFLIVTPVFNAGTFIDEAIASVLRQRLPGHTLHYHVQDGGSTDGTLDRLRAWQRRLSDDSYIPDADRITFTFASERDGGMYDALQRGFARLEPRSDDILTWINSDDCLAQGSLVTVAGVFRDVPGCEFLSGRIALLNEEGAVVVLGMATPYARGALADGLHDGRTLPFIMQEGTFYSGRVWNAVGGVDPAFRLAGDWDLWRRMARVARHCVVDTVTGYHRRRAGQLSGDMASYHREIDTAPVLPPAGDLGTLGSFVMYDIANATWVEIAFDPAAVAAPRLLRDGRSEANVPCRPVSGFAAPEGPYAQYQLPGGIRWIEGNRAGIAMSVPAAGRYRIRLALRPSRADLVLGVGVGVRARQPITLEPPAPQVDQIVETVRWLDAGEQRLCLDCDGSPDARSVLLIRCEVTSIDEDFLRRPTLPPVRPGRIGRGAPAIAILCDDDEPDLLDLSLADCAATVPDATVFVVRESVHAAVERVIGRHAIVAGRIDAGDVRADPASLRRRLHDAGHADVLVMRRGSSVTPRGIDAARALLDASGAGAARGLVNVRDSMGRSLYLSDPQGDAPVLYRAGGRDDGALRVGCALVQTIGRPQAAGDMRVLWLLDGDRPVLGRTPALLLAAGLALLGYDVRHIVVADGAWPALPSDAAIIASQGLAGTSGATMTIGRDGDRLRLVAQGGAAVDLPLAVDTDLLLPRDRAEARTRLGFSPDERIVCIAETSARATAATITWVMGMPGGTPRILNFGHPLPAGSPSQGVLALDTVGDPLLISYLLGAADVAVTSEPGGGPLAAAAWSCGVAVVDLNGRALGPTDAPADADRARDLMVATRSVAALALAIDERCPDLARPDTTATAPLHLRSGAVAVRSYGRSGQPGGFESIASFGPVTVFGDAAPFVAEDGERGRSIAGDSGEIVVSLDQPGVTTLRLHVRGTPGDAWTARADGGATAFRIGEEGDAMVSVAGDYDIGPVRVTFERQDGERQDGVAPDPAPPLHIVALSQTGAAITVAHWEETRFEPVSADAREAPTLEIDGDWQRASGFLSEQAPVPPVGMYVPFHWNDGDSCTIRVRVTTGGPRIVHLALAAGMRGQRVRLVVDGQASDWSTPLVGPIGHLERRAWRIDWPTGDVEVVLEISDVLRTMPQEVGLMLFGVTLERP